MLVIDGSETFILVLALCPFFARTGLENTSYRQRLRVLSVKAFNTIFNLYKRIASISSGKEKVDSNFINTNADLN